MEKAIVLLTIQPSAEKEVLNTLKKLKAVKEAHFIYGPYDAFLSIEADTSQKIQRIVLDKIRLIQGIKSTMTCFIAD